MKEEMMGELSGAQKQEVQRSAAFKELKDAKTSEIESGEKRAEKKEDELATTANNLAEAEADAAFAERKQARMEEINAVSETIGILMDDTARDTFSRTYQFMQVFNSEQTHKHRDRAAVA